MGLGGQSEAVHDLNEMKERIQDLVNILSDFRRKRDPAISREEYMNRLRSYCAKFPRNASSGWRPTRTTARW